MWESSTFLPRGGTRGSSPAALRRRPAGPCEQPLPPLPRADGPAPPAISSRVNASPRRTHLTRVRSASVSSPAGAAASSSVSSSGCRLGPGPGPAALMVPREPQSPRACPLLPRASRPLTFSRAKMAVRGTGRQADPGSVRSANQRQGGAGPEAASRQHRAGACSRSART